MYFTDLLIEYRQLLKQMKSEGVTSGSIYQEVKQAIGWKQDMIQESIGATTRMDAYSFDPYHMRKLYSIRESRYYASSISDIENGIVPK